MEHLTERVPQDRDHWAWGKGKGVARGGTQSWGLSQSWIISSCPQRMYRLIVPIKMLWAEKKPHLFLVLLFTVTLAATYSQAGAAQHRQLEPQAGSHTGDPCPSPATAAVCH